MIVLVIFLNVQNRKHKMDFDNLDKIFKTAEPIDMVDLPDEFDTDAEPPADIEEGLDEGGDMGGGDMGGGMGGDMGGDDLGGGGMGGDMPSSPGVDYDQFFYNRTDDLDDTVKADEDEDIDFSRFV